MNRFSRWARGRRSGAVAAFIALCGIASSAYAEVEYVRAIPIPISQDGSYPPPVLPVTQAPYVTGDPDNTNELPPLVDGTSAYWNLDATLGLYPRYESGAYPPNVKLNAYSRLAWLGQNNLESGPTLVFLTPQRQIITLDVWAVLATSLPRIDVEYEAASSIAARSLDDPISAILDSEHYAIDRLTGIATLRPLDGVDTPTTQFMSYGADGLLYVLDYGNSRIASFDPDNIGNPFAPVSSFTLESGVTTANIQFAIGINGSFYLGDGLGGGSYYNSLGAFQGVFTLPEDTTTSTYRGESYITTGADGSVYIYDNAYGFHQYQDSSVVPEPSTGVLVLTAILGTLFLRGRRQVAGVA